MKQSHYNVCFGANLKIIDKGNCFSMLQKHKLKSFAKNIDNNTSICIGTRKHNSLNIYDDSIITRKDLRAVSLYNNEISDLRFVHNDIVKNIEQEINESFQNLPKRTQTKLFNTILFNKVKKYLTDFKLNSQTELKQKNNKETSKRVIQDMKKFTSFKRGYSTETTWNKIKKLFEIKKYSSEIRKTDAEYQFESDMKQKCKSDFWKFISLITGT
ncbi:MAG: hypothetical protein RR064_05010 [Oscillospiraceae bacterium]